MRRSLPVSTLLALLFVSVSFADEGRRPIWQPRTLTAGDSGKFIVTGNISAGSGDAIRIVGSGIEDVDIDLNGFTIFGAPGAHTIRVSDVRSFTIRNGRVRNSATGLVALDVINVDEVVVEDLSVANGNAGIRLFNPRSFAVRRNVALDPLGVGGIVVSTQGGVLPLVQGVIEDNIVRNATFTGIFLQGSPDEFSGVSISNNRVEVASTGISATGTGLTIRGNTVTGCTADGIAVTGASDTCKLTQNVAAFNDGDGIDLDGLSNCFVLENVSSNNGGNGIRVASSTHSYIRQNLLNENGLAGIEFDAASSENTYGENIGRGNLAAPGACASNPPACGSPQICDDGTNNTTAGDNQFPGAC